MGIKQLFGQSKITELTEINQLHFPKLNQPLLPLDNNKNYNNIPFHNEFLMIYGKVNWNNEKGSFQIFDTSKINVKKVIAGEQFILILSNNGKCYLFDTNNKENIPILLKWTVDEPIENIFGHDYLILLTKKGELFTFKSQNGSYLAALENNYLQNKIDLKKINYEKIIDIDCGNEFYLILTENNNIYGFGSNYCGQLGTNEGSSYEENNTTFKKANTKNIKSKIIKVYCTYNTSIILTEDGKCYACGDSTYSADENEFIEKVIPGLFFVGLKAKSGKYFVFGYNNYCQFGRSDTIPQGNVQGPRLLNTFNSYDIEEMECGGYNTTIVTKNRDVYITGLGSDAPFYPVKTTDGFVNLNLKNYIQHEAFIPNSKMKLKLAMGRYFGVIYSIVDVPKNVWNFKRSIKLNDLDLIIGSDESVVSECEFMDDIY
ncbi:hypothetical protein ABK040_004531 [Willaertia magna]